MDGFDLKVGSSSTRHSIMTKKLLIALFILLGLGVTRLYAGWYECYHFSGTIDKNPISLFIQVREGYFGEKNKKEFNIIGVYKYDHYNDPIRLEGKINLKDNKVLIYELDGDKHAATFEFDFLESTCKGVWKNLSTNKTLPLQLNYVSKLIDTVENNQFANIDVLQANSFDDLYFVGVYSKKIGSGKAQMDRLKILRKKDNTIYQIIDFSKADVPAGNVSTIIFDNVEITNRKKKEFTVWADTGRTGGLFTITFNLKSQKFTLHPEPVVDGSN